MCHKSKSKPFTYQIRLLSQYQTVVKPKLPPPPPGGGCQKKFNTGRLRPNVPTDPLPFYTPFLAEKIPLPYTFHWQMEPLSYTFFFFVYLLLEKSIPFTYKLKQYSHKVCFRNILMKGPFKYLNDRFPYPFIYIDS